MSGQEIKKAVLEESKLELFKSLRHLEYGAKKTQAIPLTAAALEDDETLEAFEGLASRFARSSDIFISRYLRTYVMLREPGFRGSLLDFLHQAEKLGLIASVELWTEIRELRNSAAHEYAKQELQVIFRKLMDLSPHLLNLRKIIP